MIDNIYVKIYFGKQANTINYPSQKPPRKFTSIKRLNDWHAATLSTKLVPQVITGAFHSPTEIC